jgi:DNA processing protein
MTTLNARVAKGSLTFMGPLTATEALGPLNAVEARHAPKQLWLEGDRGLLSRHPRVAVIGTRSPTRDGIARARKLVRGLVEHRAVVVSGLAAGIDTVAHLEAIERGGRTIAVIGTPLEQAYPSENARLQRRIATEHLVVSEFAPGSPVQKKNFPIRNRTMALVSDASVIVEAGPTSGTVSQGWEALRLGRPLFLLQSLVHGPLAWPKEMLAYGAMPLVRLDDLLEYLPAEHRFAAAPF